MEPRRKPGTRPKGERRAITVRVPAEQRPVYERAATAAGYDNLSDYVTALLAEHHSLAVPAYAKRPEQGTLLEAG